MEKVNSIKQLALTIPGFGAITPPPGIPVGGLNTGTPGTGYSAFENILQTLISASFIFIIILVLVYLIWGGIDWIFSHGDKGKIETARLKIFWAIMGLFVTLFSILIVNFIGYFFGLDYFGLQAPSCNVGLGGC